MQAMVQLPLNEEFKQYENSQFIVDWVHGFCDSPFVSRFFNDLEAIDPELFAFERFVLQKNGFRNYSVRFNHDNKSEIVICYTPRFKDELDPEGYDPEVDGYLASSKDYTTGTNRGIYVQFSGDGCRKIGDKNFLAVMQLLQTYNFKCSRFDVACDIFNPECDVLSLLNDTFLSVSKVGLNVSLIEDGTPLFRSRAVRKHITGNFPIDLYREDRHVDYYNWTWGHKATSFKFRMYDKWLEIRSVTRHKNTWEDTLSNLPLDFWWRLEYELHDERAAYCFGLLISGAATSQIFLETCKDCFTPVVGQTNSNGLKNVSYLHSFPEWEVFIKFVSQFVSKTIDFV